MAAIPLPSPVVLNVDDDDTVRYVRSRLLRNAGFRVLEASTGLDAVRMAAESHPDLVVLDVNLPDISGLEVCRRIKEHNRNAPVPVLQITSVYADPETNVRSLEIGADAYLSEPVEPSVLIATARALLRPAKLTDQLARAGEQMQQRLIEMARLRVEAESAADRLARLQSLTAALSEADTLDEVLDVIVDRNKAVTGAIVSSVALFSADGRNFELARSRGYAPAQAAAITRFPLDAPFPMSDAVRQRDVVFVPDARERRRRYPQLPRASADGAVVAVPMILHGRIIGGLGLRFAGGRRLSERDREFYMNMGAQCAAAVERARLHDSERRLLNRERLARERLEELAAKNRLLSQLIDLSPDAIIVCDAERRVTRWNRGAEQIYGWTAAEASGRNIDGLVGADNAALRSELLERGRWEGEVVHSLRDGSRVTVESRHVLVRDASGKPAAYLEINRDLTERLRNEMILRSAQKLESIGHLAGGIAHDFNNLLTAIIGHASTLDNLTSERERSSVEVILQAGHRAAELTRQLLAYAGRGQFVVDRVDLSATINQIYGLLRSAVPAEAELRLDLASGLPPVLADPGQMQQLALNLVSNAGEALVKDRPGFVNVRTHAASRDSEAQLPQGGRLAPGCYVCLEVADNGSGIEPSNLAKIFDPFFTTRFFGRGLGLPAVQGIVRSLRGGIEVESDPGTGSTFRIWIPAAQA